jgi:hypothetical protein
LPWHVVACTRGRTYFPLGGIGQRRIWELAEKKLLY